MFSYVTMLIHKIHLETMLQASPKGQMIFDRLLKACNEVVWKNESIIVLQTIQVDPPYEQENCKLLKGGSAQGSLDRVQKIVAAASSVK